MIGASAGGIPALTSLVGGLPPDIDAAALVVLHLGATARTVLPALLQRAGSLPATLATDMQHPHRGQILVAPPDYHLIVDDGVVRLSHGPRIGGQRPSIDELFRSAARSHGRRTIAVVLSGTLDDGSAGVLSVRRAGGTVVVQDPEDASFPDMPASAMRRVEPDHVLPAAQIGPLLGRLAALPAPDDPPADPPAELGEEPTDPEGRGVLPASGYTCPECGGALWPRLEDDALRCRVGHTWSPETLVDAQSTRVEAALWAAMRALEEQADMARHLAERAGERGDARGAERFRRLLHDARGQARALDQIVRRGAGVERPEGTA